MLETTQYLSTLPPQAELMQMLWGSWINRAIYVAAKLGIADLLKDSPKHCNELASITQTNTQSLYRLLRALASVGIFAETESACFTLTPVAHYLRSDLPDSLRAFSLFIGAEHHYRAWGDLMYGVQTGTSSFEHLYGMPIFQYYDQNPELAEVFDQAMTSFSSTIKNAVVASYDFSTIRTLVDVGGGQGHLLASVLQANLQTQGILFEQPSAIEKAKLLLENAGVLNRCNFVGGNFFESVPTEGDAYILQQIIHDWSDEQAIAILMRCREAMAGDEKLLLVEQVIPPGNDPFFGKLVDLHMLVMLPGRERTETEYQALFEKSGFQLVRIVPTQTTFSIIEGIPS